MRLGWYSDLTSVERRTYWACFAGFGLNSMDTTIYALVIPALTATLDALGGWPGLRTVLAVESIRSVNGAPKVESEIRYFLSSCPDAPAVLGQAIRSHWAVENALHWVLDVTFREDDSRVRDRTAARNLALMRKIALNIVGRDTTSKASVRARRKRAAWNDAYMLKLLAG